MYCALLRAVRIVGVEIKGYDSCVKCYKKSILYFTNRINGINFA